MAKENHFEKNFDNLIEKKYTEIKKMFQNFHFLFRFIKIFSNSENPCFLVQKVVKMFQL